MSGGDGCTRRYRGHLDLTVEHLADDGAALLERAADLETERNAYRELAHAALDRLARLTDENRRLRARLRDLWRRHQPATSSTGHQTAA